MPSDPTRNMSGGKHWTKAELEAREIALADTERETRRYMMKPDWLSEEARVVWESTLRKLSDLELLDKLDTEMLAIYCDAVVKYSRASQEVDKGELVGKELTEMMKSAQSWARIVASFADKLGLSPQGRARLARKKAVTQVDDFEEAFG